MHTHHSRQLSRAAATVAVTVTLLTAPALVAHAADPDLAAVRDLQ